MTRFYRHIRVFRHKARLLRHEIMCMVIQVDKWLLTSKLSQISVHKLKSEQFEIIQNIVKKKKGASGLIFVFLAYCVAKLAAIGSTAKAACTAPLKLEFSLFFLNLSYINHTLSKIRRIHHKATNNGKTCVSHCVHQDKPSTLLQRFTARCLKKHSHSAEAWSQQVEDGIQTCSAALCSQCSATSGELGTNAIRGKIT